MAYVRGDPDSCSTALLFHSPLTYESSNSLATPDRRSRWAPGCGRACRGSGSTEFHCASRVSYWQVPTSAFCSAAVRRWHSVRGDEREFSRRAPSFIGARSRSQLQRPTSLGLKG